MIKQDEDKDQSPDLNMDEGELEDYDDIGDESDLLIPDIQRLKDTDNSLITD